MKRNSLIKILSVCTVMTMVVSCAQGNPEPLAEKDIPMDEINDTLNDEATMGNHLLHSIELQLYDRDIPVKVLMKFPKGEAKGTIVLLQGWNLGYQEWCTKTSVCDKALEMGYVLVLPDMGKSTYQTEFYAETRKEWRLFPTKTWLVDTCFTYLQEHYNILLKDQRSFVLGLSTGGRGAGLLALECPDIFSAGASLSGDFDQSLLLTDKIYNGFYGPYDKFKERWEGRDNILNRAAEFKVPMYLGHSKLDRICPVDQTTIFYDTIRAVNPSLEVILNIDTTLTQEKAHSYDYWGMEVDAVLKFFNSH